MDTDAISSVYAECCVLPTPLSANITEQQLNDQRIYTINTEWSQTNLVRGSRIRYTQQWTLLAEEQNSHQTVHTVLPPGPCGPLQGESEGPRPGHAWEPPPAPGDLGRPRPEEEPGSHRPQQARPRL